MPPEDRFVVRFGAEPPQDPLPYGRWADTLQAEFLAAALRIDTEGTELGYASFAPGDADTEPGDFYSWADFTDETADANPEWKMDLCEEVIGGWRGEGGEVAAMTLVWGVPIVRGGA